jgi:hypothetical protein
MTPFCSTRADCSNHGECVQSKTSITCQCDAGYEGDKCGSAICPIHCMHGGVPDTKCTKCVSCLGGWYGDNCTLWNASFPPSLRSELLVSLKNASDAKLKHDLSYNPFCRAQDQCVGWGADVTRGGLSMYPILELDFTDPATSGQSPSGLVYPKGVKVTPYDNPQWFPDTQAFPTGDVDSDSYATWIQTNYWRLGGGLSGVYSSPLLEVWNGVYQDAADQSFSVSQATLNKYTMDVLVHPGSPSGYAQRLDNFALAALQSLGPYEQDKGSWHTFFENWGTSVVTSSRHGGMIEYLQYWKTVLSESFTTEQLKANAKIGFTKATTLGGHTGTLDPLFSQYKIDKSDADCYGGDPRLCDSFHIAAGNYTDWVSSLEATPFITSFTMEPLWKLIQGNASTVEQSAVYDAVQAYVQEKNAAWNAHLKSPPTCNDHGAVKNTTSGQPDRVCTCHDCFRGRQCSTFAYAGKPGDTQSVSMSIYRTFSHGTCTTSGSQSITCVNGEASTMCTKPAKQKHGDCQDVHLTCATNSNGQVQAQEYHVDRIKCSPGGQTKDSAKSAFQDKTASAGGGTCTLADAP